MSYASDALIDAQMAEIRWLGDDNAKLRSASERDADVMDVLRYCIGGLKAENDGLRELAVMLYRCATGMFRDLSPSCADADVDGCGMDCINNGEGCCMALIRGRMRELGIEVER